uniref:Minor capsid protein L2 n=1 Tax=Mops bat papillomavirus TaxID=3141892 RepID=A0AAU7E2L2_9PAPI
MGLDCPPDIKNKFEQNTPADRILKIGGTVIYLGGLGIGTGKGSGYTPIRGGGGVRVGVDSGVARPGLPPGTVGPLDIIPIDPGGPAIVPRVPYIPNEGIPYPEFPSIVEEIELFRPPDVPGRLPGEVPSTTITSGDAVLEVEQVPHIIARTQYDNPSFEINITTSINGPPETSAPDHVLVYSELGGVDVGGAVVRGGAEEIELRDFTPSFSESTQRETTFTTSTPDPIVYRPEVPRPLRPYGRQLQQVRVRDARFLDRPSELISSNVFENPAFEDDVSLEFERGLAAIAEDRDFQDVVRLSRPSFARRTEGLRVSRIGNRAGTVRTRSGIEVGGLTHFYYDISDINAPDTIEMSLLGEQSSGPRTQLVDDGTSSFEVIDLADIGQQVPDEELLDVIEDTTGSSLQLIIEGAEDTGRTVIDLPIDLTIRRGPHFYPDVGGVAVLYPSGDNKVKPAVIPGDLITPIEPIFPGFLGSLDYDLHPSLYPKKKRKRAYL